jgi:hypothetical protein
MEVELYVYDLSGGMARQYSVALTGVYIDAIYHTAVVLGGVEYFFGQGIHRKVPGSTHHGRPMEVMKMGRTELPIEVVEEYVQSLESIYTPESYDLFLHNCNNFSQDLCMFLVGKSIPEKISSLPETFLKTPIGQMMRGQIDQSMRRMTQAPDAVSGQNARSAGNSQTRTNGMSSGQTNGVHPSRPIFINSALQGKGAGISTHPHNTLKLPLLSKRIPEPILATTSPPLDKLLTRIASALPDTDVQPMKDLAAHVQQRSAQGSANAPLPDMSQILTCVTDNFKHLALAQFALVDLLRVSALDPRISAYLATNLSILKKLHSRFAGLGSSEAPYNLHFTTLQLCMNLFSSPVAQEALAGNDKSVKESPLRELLAVILPPALLAQNPKLRLQAALLLINLAALDHNQRIDGREDLVRLESWADGAVASALVQAVIEEVDSAALEKLLLALGLLLWKAEESTVQELCEVMAVKDALEAKQIDKVTKGLKGEVLMLLGGT